MLKAERLFEMKCLYMLAGESDLAFRNLCNLIRAHVLVDCGYVMPLSSLGILDGFEGKRRLTRTHHPQLPPIPLSAGYRGRRN